MKKQILLSAVLACISEFFLRQHRKSRLDYVNPFVGTTNYGTTNPGRINPYHGIDVG